jgi:hypothetical protein
VRRSPVVLIGLAGVLMAAFVSVAGSSLTLAGAPPLVPHPVSDALAEGKACLPCHADGGWAPSFGAYAPVVPHPELQSAGSATSPRG